MSANYEIILHNTKEHFIKECPVILKSYALTKDMARDAVLAQCKFENLSIEPISSIRVGIKCYSIEGIEYDGVPEFQYLDLYATQFYEFGSKTPIYLPNAYTRKIEITIYKVIFKNGEIWENKYGDYFETVNAVPHPISDLGYYADQYAKEVHKYMRRGIAPKYIGEKSEDFVRCSCGKLLPHDTKFCPKCGMNIDMLEKICDEQYLEEQIENDKKMEEMKAAEAAAEKAEAEAEKKRKIKKIMKILVPIITVIAVVTIGISTLENQHFFAPKSEVTLTDGTVITCSGYKLYNLYKENDSGDNNPYANATVEINETVEYVIIQRYTSRYYRVTVTGGWIIYTDKEYSQGENISLTCYVAKKTSDSLNKTILYDENFSF
jgi:hypothetical protein